MLYLIAPYEPTLPFSEEAAADRISAAEKNAPIRLQMMNGSKISESIWKKYVLFEDYPPETYKQVDDFADILFSMPICALSTQTTLPVRIFCRYINDNRSAYRRIIGGIASGKFKSGDNVSDLKWQKHEPEFLNFFHSYMKFPTLVEMRKKKIVISQDASENNSILPYVVALAEFDYLPPNIRDTLVYSCILYIKKRSTD